MRKDLVGTDKFERSWGLTLVRSEELGEENWIGNVGEKRNT